MTRQRRCTKMDPKAQALGFADVDEMIRSRFTAGKQRQEIADELGVGISAISKRIYKHLPDLVTTPDGLDRHHYHIVARYVGGESVDALGKSLQVSVHRVRKILAAEEERTGEKIVREPWERHPDAPERPRPRKAGTAWDPGTGTSKPGRDVEDIDMSGDSLAQQLAQMKPEERQETVSLWQDVRAEARIEMETTPKGSRQRITAALMVAEFGARLRQAQKVAA